jgi:hypothetical protein
MFRASTSIKFVNSAGASAGFAHAQWQRYQFCIARNTLKLSENASAIGSDANGVITEPKVIYFPLNTAQWRARWEVTVRNRKIFVRAPQRYQLTAWHRQTCCDGIVSYYFAKWEIIADNLKKAGWGLGWVSALGSEGRTI